MRKVKLEVDEKLTYRRIIYVNVPDDMEDAAIERILNKAEQKEYLADFMSVLEANNMEAPDGYDDDLRSPWESEVECVEYNILEAVGAQNNE